mmetsp:Transcript_43555/g.99084  ORF Transcript_43555/g.99084 Transcript_43555/m.99084 type:complete len:300 (+) Transcript_43555:163-1062(+)
MRLLSAEASVFSWSFSPWYSLLVAERRRLSRERAEDASFCRRSALSSSSVSRSALSPARWCRCCFWSEIELRIRPQYCFSAFAWALDSSSFFCVAMARITLACTAFCALLHCRFFGTAAAAAAAALLRIRHVGCPHAVARHRGHDDEARPGELGVEAARATAAHHHEATHSLHVDLHGRLPRHQGHGVDDDDLTGRERPLQRRPSRVDEGHARALERRVEAPLASAARREAGGSLREVEFVLPPERRHPRRAGQVHAPRVLGHVEGDNLRGVGRRERHCLLGREVVLVRDAEAGLARAA